MAVGPGRHSVMSDVRDRGRGSVQEPRLVRRGSRDQLRVDEGEVFALLGPNGAGKTTTLEILEGHRRRSGGRVSVLGVDPEFGGRALRERIGIVLQSAGMDAELTVREMLAL